jgi:hypothetical protein|nr:type II secretion system protein GspG [Kofleriaceae bacterium]
MTYTLALVRGGVNPISMERSKNDVARSAAKAIAYEAYPQWSIAHPDKQCPSSIADLASYADGSKMLDPWGNPFVFMCGPTMPPGEKGVLVVSAGEDGRSGTPDDIKSSDE